MPLDASTYQADICPTSSLPSLYFAQIHSFGPLPEQFEMRRICLCEQMPQPQTYPLIQPKLLEWVQQFLLKQTIPE